MLRRAKIAVVVVVMAVLVATWTMLGTAVAQKTATPKSPDKLALGEVEVKQLLLLMDTDKNGKISKQEWMKFMEAEFSQIGLYEKLTNFLADLYVSSASINWRICTSTVAIGRINRSS